MAFQTVKVEYSGDDSGPIYLGDVGQRNQLGGGKGLYTMGQDRYIKKDETATFIGTSDVAMSAGYAGADRTGRIKWFEDNGTFTVTLTP